MPKPNKIIVCMSADEHERRRMLQRMAVKIGLATTPGDASKLIRMYPQDFDLTSTYLVMAERYDLNSSHHTTQQLYRMALSGMAVVIGARRVQPQFEFMCEIIQQGEI